LIARKFIFRERIADGGAEQNILGNCHLIVVAARIKSYDHIRQIRIFQLLMQ